MPGSPLVDVLVVGGGHAGCEAAAAAARLGCSVLLVTADIDRIGLMSCNPAVGGIGKGQLVRELDALGGLMGLVTDRCGIHFRRLNTSKGRAVRATRVQVDRRRYRRELHRRLERLPGISLRQAEVTGLHLRGRAAAGVRTALGETLRSRTVILAPGTFLNGLIHVGLTSFPGGRFGEGPSVALAAELARLGFELGRFKTGTPPRVDGRTLDIARMEVQPGDEPPPAFSFASRARPRNRLACYVTHTNAGTHRIVRGALDRSPLYSGVIRGTGVRYCPSIEDKVVRFADRARHQVFVEPEGLDTFECYPNGISTSLPVDVQLRMLHSIPGLERCRMVRPGYAIEHDFVQPTQLHPTLETRLLRNLFLAGQVNGTTGYEEAAAQGLLAGANAALRVLGRDQLALSRAESVIGVMVDDLTARGTDEPYRMFSARVENRLLLREDNADLRLTPLGRRLGLVTPARAAATGRRRRRYEAALEWLRRARVRPGRETDRLLAAAGSPRLNQSQPALELLRRPEVDWSLVARLAGGAPDTSPDVVELVEVEVKYAGYIERCRRQQERFRELESVAIPPGLDFELVPGLSFEVREKLARLRPATVARAGSIPGVTPVAQLALVHYLRGGN